MKRTELRRKTPLRNKKGSRPASPAKSIGRSRKPGATTRGFTSRRVKELDAINSRITRAVGWCAKCGATHNLEHHHPAKKQGYWRRYHPRNRICLCHSCHRWAEEHPSEFSYWLRRWSPAFAEAIESIRSDTAKHVVFYVEVRDRLREELKGITQ
jgi:hypothetical protein